MHISNSFLSVFKSEYESETPFQASLCNLNLTLDFLSVIGKYYGVNPELRNIEFSSHFKPLERKYKRSLLFTSKRKGYYVPKIIDQKHNPHLNFGSFRYVPDILRMCRAEEWSLKDGKLIVNSSVQSSSQVLPPYNNLATVILRLTKYEDLFPGQKFLKYFDMARALENLDHIKRLNLKDFAIRRDVNVKDNGIFYCCRYGFPTAERIAYLYWKKHFQSFCSHNDFTRLPLKVYLFSNAGVLSDGPREVEYRKNSIWKEKWNNKDVWSRLVKVDRREDIVINIHQHEINDEVTKRNIPHLPDNVSVSPSVYYKDILNDLFAKKEYLYVNNLKFPSVDADKFASHKGQFIPIPDSFTLINEGKSLKHCIGQEKYISWGNLGECMYFRYIPSGIDKDDYASHFTITLFKTEIDRFPTKDELALQALSNAPVYQDEDEDVWRCAIEENLDDRKKQVYFLREVWGWENETPEEDNLLEIYDFLYQNQKLFTL